MRLDGVDGSHLFGFMTALGVLRLLDEDATERRLLRPTLAFDPQYAAGLGNVTGDQAAIVESLAHGLNARAIFYRGELADVNKPADFTRATFEAALARTGSRWERDVLSGLACGLGNDDIAESTLCAANGAGHQELIRSIRDVLALVEPSHLEAALFHPWSKAYSIPPDKRKALALGTRKPALRLDPADERLYALRATDPTSKTSAYTTELGAQALAIPAFELLPVCPSRRPTCIASRRGRGRVVFEWSLWNVPATLATVRSFLAVGLREPEVARARGAFAGFSVARVSGAKGKLSIGPSIGTW